MKLIKNTKNNISLKTQEVIIYNYSLINLLSMFKKNITSLFNIGFLNFSTYQQAHYNNHILLNKY
ncbi:MAG: hypothetical protein LiPW30_190 [Parcubacteria group bacterium LiPW_30]|mgnify:CR=1 FL=1|nr:MAG: hypothetical protein LiPW30_190 [Parcubacteria group bacterium LiPW_30]